MNPPRSKVIALIAVAVIVIAAAAAGVFILYGTPPALDIELDPSSPLRAKPGENFSLSISVRNGVGLKAVARHVRGELELPEGFIEESLQTRTRQLIFGSIGPGDASHYGLTIIVTNSTVTGEYHAELTVWGDNVPIKAIDIKITVYSS